MAGLMDWLGFGSDTPADAPAIADSPINEAPSTPPAGFKIDATPALFKDIGEGGLPAGFALDPPDVRGPKATPISYDPRDAISQAAETHGVDPATMHAFARIESSGNPNARTGSYKGLFQLSDDEFARNGGRGDIYDPTENANAAARKIANETQSFKNAYGRDPTAGELYLIHQQGAGGAAEHWANPDLPAWQNMYATAEGQQKGQNWAKRAIWGNVPDDVKAQYGSVDNMTSRDFTQLWNDKIARFGGAASTDLSQDPSQAAITAQPAVPAGFTIDADQAPAQVGAPALPDGFTLDTVSPQPTPQSVQAELGSAKTATPVPAGSEAPGWGETVKGAVKSGYYNTMQGIHKMLNPTTDIEKMETEAPDESKAGKLLAKPISEGYSDPKWWAAQAIQGGTEAAPAIAGTMGAAAAGAPALAAAGVGGLYFGATRLVPAYEEARRDGLSHDEAVTRAMEQAGISTATGTAMGVAPELKVLGKTAEGAVKRPISEALAQIFLVQPSIGAAGQEAQGLVAGKQPTADELATGYAGNVGMGAGFTAAHMLFGTTKQATIDAARPFAEGVRARREAAAEAPVEPTVEEGGPIQGTDIPRLPPPAGFTVDEPVAPKGGAPGGGAAGPAGGRQGAGLAPDHPSAEPIEDLVAQAKDLADPKSSRQAVWLPYASLKNVLDSNQATAVLDPVGAHAFAIPDFDNQGGTMLFRDRDVAMAAQARVDAGEDMQAVIGSLVGSGKGKPAGATKVVQQVTPEGAVTRESAVTDAEQAATEKEFAKGGKEVQTVPVEEAIQRRADGVGNSKRVQSGVAPIEAGGEVSAPAQAEAGRFAALPEKPAVPVKKMVFADLRGNLQINSLIDGSRHQDLRPYLAEKGVSIKDYVDHFGVADDQLVSVENGERVTAGEAIAAEQRGTRGKPVKIETAEHVKEAGKLVAEPTAGQAAAGNYQKGHVDFKGLPITIETPKGGTRIGRDRVGNETWRVEDMPAAYGYVKRTEGADGDHVDVYVGDDVDSDRVYIIDQVKLPDREFDEHKAMLGFNSRQAAIDAYTKAFSDGQGATRIRSIAEKSIPQFKEWLAKGARNRPAAGKAEPLVAAEDAETEEPAKEAAKKGRLGTTLQDLAKTDQGNKAAAERIGAKEEPAKQAAKSAEAPGPDEARGVVAAPSFDDVMEHVGEDDDGHDNIAALQELMHEHFGKGAWFELTDAEKIAVWEEVTGELYDPSMFQEMTLADREAAAREEMDSDEWRRAVTKTPDNDTSKVEGYETEEYQKSRRYIAADGSDIVGVEAARDYLRESAVDKIPGGLKSEHRAIVLLGLPGAGKSTICDVLSERFGAAHLSADDARLIIPEYDGGKNSEGTLTEGSDLIQATADMMAANGQNFIIETVGSSEARVSGRAKTLTESGIAPLLVFVDTPKAIAMERAVARFHETGRAMPADLYDKLDPGGMYERAKEAGLFEETARIVWDEDANTWRVTDASPAFADLEEAINDGTLRQPGVGGRGGVPGDEERIRERPETVGARKPKAAGEKKAAAKAKPKRRVSSVVRLNQLGKKLVGKDKDAWEEAAPELQRLIKEVELEHGETATTKSTRESLQQLGLMKQKIGDAGEKIGGARKDMWAQRGLDISDLEQMTGAERASLVNKTAVFPRPDYKQMVEDGVEPVAAHLVKQIYDRVPLKPGGTAYESLPDREDMRGYVPGSRHRETKSTPESYITALKYLRKLVSEVKTVDDAKQLNHRFQEDVKTAADPRLIETSLWKKSGKYRLKSPLPVSWADERRAKDAVDKQGFPGTEPWQKKWAVLPHEPKGKPEGWKVVPAQYRWAQPEAGNLLPTQEAAIARAKELYEGKLGKTREGEPKRPHLDKLERTGPDYREGKHVNSQDFIDTFGFKGVEFGNWVAGDERQKVVNLGFDALSDLARVLGIPPKAISLDGSLSLAFGARGKGGFAAAHYEPGRLVVNMTKLTGAGALAHEWGHALDHYIGEVHAENPYSAAPTGASGWYKEGPFERSGADIETMPPRLRNAVKKLMVSIFYRQETDAEVVARAAKLTAQSESSLKAWADHLAGLEKRASDPYKAKERGLKTQLRKAKDAVSYWRIRLKALQDQQEHIKRLQIESDYFKNAKKLSGKSGAEGYWARPTELFARSFEAYVFDKLEKGKHVSQYLVQGVEPNRFGNGFKGNPYPAGDERKAIDASYDRLMKALKAETGKVGEGSKLSGMAGEVEPTEAGPEDHVSEYVNVRALTSKEKLGQLTDEMKAVEEGTEKAKSPLELVRDKLMADGFEHIVAARSFVKKAGFEGSTKEVDELIERAAVAAARDIVASHDDPKETYQALVELYGRQPRLTQRTSESVSNQAYSTPMPLAYVASRLAKVAEAKFIYEPTAGNGALLIEADPAKQRVYANELDPARAEALKEQGFAATSYDAAEKRPASALGSSLEVESVIANPPFGAVREGGESKDFTVTVDGKPWVTTSVDHAIAFRALSQMKNDGHAVLLLGGVTAAKKNPTPDAIRQGYRAQAKREFYWRLYNNYNVVDHFTIAGDLYEKQGAGFPVDVIVINGRGKSERPLPQAEAPRIYDDWSKLGEALNGPSEEATKPTVGEDGGATTGGGRPARGNATGGERPVRGGRGELQPEGEGNTGGVRGERGGEQSPDVRTPDADKPAGGALEPVRELGGANELSHPIVGQPKLTAQANAAGQAAYVPQSKVKSVNTLTPANMAAAAKQALQRVEDKHGPIDKFVSGRLGYETDAEGPYFLNDRKEKVRPFSAEQMDAIALAIDNLERPSFTGDDGVMRGSALILGDQTGIGKGRVVAAMLRYALKNDLVPLFVTKEPKLYGDMFRDFDDIGLQQMLGRPARILMTNTEPVPLDEAATEFKSAYDEWAIRRDEAKANGTKFEEKAPKRSGSFLTMTKAKVDAGIKAMLAHSGKGEAPFDFVFTTYPQLDSVKGGDTDRRRFVEALAPKAFLVMDEAHEAGGSGPAARKPGKNKDGTEKARTRATFFRDLVKTAKTVMYSSATYAKRPDVMDLYARTDMGLAVDDPKLLPGLIAKGGVPLQQVVATMLADAGQYVRREQSFQGIEYKVKVLPVNNAAYEQFSGSVRKIADFDLLASKYYDAETPKDWRRRWVQQNIDSSGGATKHDAGIGEAAAHTTAFASVMHNLVGQMLLSIKADASAEDMIEQWKAGEKPIIALSNTMESFLDEYAKEEGLKVGDIIDLDFGALLARYLKRTLRVTVKDADGKVEHHQIPLDALPSDLRQKYDVARQALESGNYEGMPISPIDWMRYRMTQAGMKVAEITGRHSMIDYSGGKQGALPGMAASPVLVARPRNEQGAGGKAVSLSKYNSGGLDALILNKSGSTGVSAHAHFKFKDKRQRHMGIVQPDQNIDVHFQMLGRINRTGQVVLPRYTQYAAEVPAEMRPLAILMKKMASLNANTTASRKGAFMSDTVDFMNEVGDKIVAKVLLYDHQLNADLGYPLKVGADGKTQNGDDIARKASGRLVLLPPKEQQEFFDSVSDAYKEEIARLDQIGENPLEARSIDLQAKHLDQTELKPRTGNGMFLGPVNLERVSAKAQGRAMKPEAVADDVSETVGGKAEGTPETRLRLLQADGRAFMQKRWADLSERFKTYRDAVAGTSEADTKAVLLKGLDDDLNRWRNTASIAYPGAQVKLLGMTVGDFDGVVTKVARTGKSQNPAALGAWHVTVAVPDTQRKFVLPMSMLYPSGYEIAEGDKGAKIETSYTPLDQLMPKFEEARKEGREDRYIVTGNVLAGYDQTKGKGQIVNYTTDDGRTLPGILMPREFKAEKFLKERAIRFNTGDQVAKFLEKAEKQGETPEVVSQDKIVKVSKLPYAWFVKMPAGRGTGGRYYTEQSVRDAIAPVQFEKRGNEMWARLERKPFVKMLDAMRKLGAMFETTSNQELAQEVTTASRRLALISPSKQHIEATLQAGEPVDLGVQADKMLATMRREPGILPREIPEAVVEHIEPFGGDHFKVTARSVDGHVVEYYDTLPELMNTAGLFNVFPDGRPAVVLFSFDTGGGFGDRLKGYRAHEGLHGLRFLGLLPGTAAEPSSLWARLVSHANSLHVMGLTPREMGRAMKHPAAESWSDRVTTGAAYRKLYNNNRNPQELVDEEAVAHMLQLYVVGHFSAQDVGPVKDIIDRILSGEIAKARPSIAEEKTRVSEFAAALNGPQRSYMSGRIIPFRDRWIAAKLEREHPLEKSGGSSGFADEMTLAGIEAELRDGEALRTEIQQTIAAVKPSEPLLPKMREQLARVEATIEKAKGLVEAAKANLHMRQTAYEKAQGGDTRIQLNPNETIVATTMAANDPAKEGSYDYHVERQQLSRRLEKTGREFRKVSDVGRSLPNSPLRFFDEALCVDHGAAITDTELYDAYKAWAASKKVAPVADKDFHASLAGFGYMRMLFAGRRRYLGMSLSKGYDEDRRYAIMGWRGSPHDFGDTERAPAGGMELDQHGLYSTALQAAKRLPQERGTVQQMRSMLVREGGAGTEKELEANGFDKRFPDPNAKVSRSDIETFLRENRVGLGQQEHGGYHTADFDDFGEFRRTYPDMPTPQAYAEWQRISSQQTQAPRFESYSTPGGIPGSYREVVTTLPTEYQKAHAAWDKFAAEMRAKYGSDRFGTDHMTPDERAQNEAHINQIERIQQTVRDYTSSHWPGITNPLLHYRVKDFVSGNPSQQVGSSRLLTSNNVETGRANASVQRGGSGEGSQVATSSVSGLNKTRVLDELQSDWAQRARDQGTRDPQEVARLGQQANEAHEAVEQAQREARKFLKENPELDPETTRTLTSAWDRAHGGDFQTLGTMRPNRLIRLLGEIGDHEYIPSQLRPQARDLSEHLMYTSDRANDLQNKAEAASRGAPSAPFISNTSDWVDLGLKQALSEAARDPSVSRFAWAPGGVQAERYNLAKVVDRVSVDPIDDPMVPGTRSIMLHRGGNFVDSVAIDKDGIVRWVGNENTNMDAAMGKPISELLGHDLAKRIADVPFNSNKEFSGQSLSVGGEGMRSFYGDWTPSGEYNPGIVGTRLQKLVKGLDPEAAKIEAGDLGPDQKRLTKFAETLRVDMAHLPHAEKAPLYDAFNAITLEGKSFDEARALTAKNKTSRQFFDEAAKAWGIDKGVPRVTYPSIPITPKLRAAILKGLPMFGGGNSKAMASALAIAPEKAAELEKGLQAAVDQALGIVARIAGRGVKVVLHEEIPASDIDMDSPTGTVGGHYTRGVVDGRALIALATNDPDFDLATTAGHEAWHHVREELASDVEKKLLDSSSEQTRMRRFAAGEIGDKAAAQLNPREVEAYAFQRYRREKDAGNPSAGTGRDGLHMAIRKFFDRILDILRRVKNALNGLGYNLYEDVFEAARTGEYGRAADAADLAKEQRHADIVDALRKDLADAIGSDGLTALRPGGAEAGGRAPGGGRAEGGAAGDGEEGSGRSIGGLLRYRAHDLLGDYFTQEAIEARAGNQGWRGEDWYHGTNRDVDELVPSGAGYYKTGTQFPVIWLSSRGKIASGFAMAHKDLWNDRVIGPANVIPARVRGKLKVIQAAFRGGNFATMDKVLEVAKSQGYDGVLFKNLHDHANMMMPFGFTGSSNVVAMFESKNVRGANDMFDYRAVNDSGLLASAPYVEADLRAELNRLVQAEGLSDTVRYSRYPTTETEPETLAAAIPRTPAEEKVGERIVSSDEVADARRLPSLDQIYTRVKDNLYPILKLEEAMSGKQLTPNWSQVGRGVPAGDQLHPDDSAYIKARLTRGNRARAEAFIMHGAYRFSDMQKIGPSLLEIEQGFKDKGGDAAGFDIYAVSKRALEYHKRGLESGIPLDEARQAIEDGKDKYDAAFRQSVRWNQQMLAYDRDAGLYTNEQYVRMTELNKDYTPYHRLMEDATTSSTGTGRGMKVRNPVKRVKGGAQQIISPLESMVRNAFLFIDIAEKNRALLQLRETWLAAGERGKEFMVRVKPKIRPIQVTDAEVKKFLDEHGIEADPEGFTIFRPNAFSPAPDEISMFVDGKREVYKVDPEVASAINGMSPESLSLFTRLLKKPASWLRAGATIAPEFAARNPVRDQFSAMTFSNNGYVPVYDFLRGAAQLWEKDGSEDWANWMKSGGGNAAMVAIDRDYINNNLLRLDAKSKADYAKQILRSPIDALRAASEFMENATRIGEFMRAQANDKSLFHSGFDTREVTLDFFRLGSDGQAVNQIIPFWNAQAEGVDRAARAFKDNPSRFLLKTLLSISLISFLTWLFNHKDQRWAELPNWEKDIYWIWMRDHWTDVSSDPDVAQKVLDKTPDYLKRQGPDGKWQINDGEPLRMPKPFELGVMFGSAFERTLSAYFDSNPHAYKDLMGSVWGALSPNWIPQFAVPVLEQMTNHSFFLDRPLVPRAQDNVLPAYQETPYTSELAKGLGWVISKIAGDASGFSSPIILDNYFREWTGGMGQHALSMVDVSLHAAGIKLGHGGGVGMTLPPGPSDTLADIPIVKAFASRFPSASAQSIQDFYETYDARAKAKGTANFLRKNDHKDAATEFAADNSMANTKRVRDTLGAQSKLIRGIYADPSMPPSDKRQLIDATYLQMIETAKRGNAFFNRTEKHPGGVEAEPEVETQE